MDEQGNRDANRGSAKWPASCPAFLNPKATARGWVLRSPEGRTGRLPPGLLEAQEANDRYSVSELQPELRVRIRGGIDDVETGEVRLL